MPKRVYIYISNVYETLVRFGDVFHDGTLDLPQEVLVFQRISKTDISREEGVCFHSSLQGIPGYNQPMVTLVMLVV